MFKPLILSHPNQFYTFETQKIYLRKSRTEQHILDKISYRIIVNNIVNLDNFFII